MQWYHAINGQRQGPISQEEFDQLVRNGQIKGDTLVWRQGMANWVSYAALMSVGQPTPAGSAAVPAAGGDDTEVCVVSGKRYPRREMIQYEGKWVSAEHRDEFFQRLREGVALPGASDTMPGPFGYGGFWRRFCAKFLDGIITSIAGAILNSLVAFLMFGSGNYLRVGREGEGTSSVLLYQAITIPIGLALGLGYAWFFISRYQATPGKMAFGMKIVRADGSRLSTGRIIGRHFAEILNLPTLLIGYIIAGFDGQKRALHDHICDTRVIKVR